MGVVTYFLENQVELLLALEELDELDNVRLILAVVEGLHLPEHAGSRVPRHLVNDLNGVLLVGVKAYASLDACIGSLA